MVDITTDIVWTEKWRPKTISEAILPKAIDKKLRQMVKNPANIPNLIFAGRSGVGKTTAARAMMAEMDADFLMINASKDRNIDTLRTKIQDFATRVSFTGQRKFVILDEADGLNPQTFQPALRNFMEEYSENCGFILTCNFLQKIIEPLQGRCSIIEFSISKDERPDLLRRFAIRLLEILKTEGVDADKRAVVEFVNRHFPNYRKILNETQSHSNIDGKIDIGILALGHNEGFDDLFRIIREKNFGELNQWVQNFDDFTIEEISSKFYARAEEEFGRQNLPQIILHLTNGDYKDKFVGNKSLNTLATLLEIMRDLEE